MKERSMPLGEAYREAVKAFTYGRCDALTATEAVERFDPQMIGLWNAMLQGKSLWRDRAAYNGKIRTWRERRRFCRDVAEGRMVFKDYNFVTNTLEVEKR